MANISVASPAVRNTTGKGSYTIGAATFRVTVQNVAPTATANSYGTNEDNAPTVNGPGVLGDDTDPGNNPLSAVLISSPRNGTLQLTSDGSFVYAPDANFSGTDTFTYRVCDSGSPRECRTAAVAVEVNPVNDAPNARADEARVQEDGSVGVSVLANDADADADGQGDLDPASVNVVEGPRNGTAEVDRQTDEITYTPNADFGGSDSFRYEVCDRRPVPQCASATVNIRGGGIQLPGPLSDEATVNPTNRSAARRMSEN